MGPFTFSAKIRLKFFPFFLKSICSTTNDSPGRGGHKPAQKCFLEGFVFAQNQDEMEVSLAPSLLVTLLRPWQYPSEPRSARVHYIMLGSGDSPVVPASKGDNVTWFGAD